MTQKNAGEEWNHNTICADVYMNGKKGNFHLPFTPFDTILVPTKSTELNEQTNMKADERQNKE